MSPGLPVLPPLDVPILFLFCFFFYSSLFGLGFLLLKYEKVLPDIVIKLNIIL